jgi:hypothetical protein
VGSCGELSFTRSLKPGGEKTRTLAFPVETYQVHRYLQSVTVLPGGEVNVSYAYPSRKRDNTVKIEETLPYVSGKKRRI